MNFLVFLIRYFLFVNTIDDDKIIRFLITSTDSLKTYTVKIQLIYYIKMCFITFKKLRVFLVESKLCTSIIIISFD